MNNLSLQQINKNKDLSDELKIEMIVQVRTEVIYNTGYISIQDTWALLIFDRPSALLRCDRPSVLLR